MPFLVQILWFFGKIAQIVSVSPTEWNGLLFGCAASGSGGRASSSLNCAKTCHLPRESTNALWKNVLKKKGCVGRWRYIAKSVIFACFCTICDSVCVLARCVSKQQVIAVYLRRTIRLCLFLEQKKKYQKSHKKYTSDILSRERLRDISKCVFFSVTTTKNC